MKTRAILPAFIAFFGLIAIAGQAQQSGTRIGFVDINEVSARSKQIDSGVDKVKAKVEEIRKKMEATHKNLSSLEAEIRKSDGVLAEKEVAGKKTEAQKLRDELLDLERQAEKEVAKLDENVFAPMVSVVSKAIEDVAKEKKLDMVLRGDAIIFSATKINITDDVVKKLNSSSVSSPTPNTKK